MRGLRYAIPMSAALWGVIIGAALMLAGCSTPTPVSRPCGVILDGLRDVRATTPEGNRRIDVHHARGRAVGCWE
jgi:hypothetical protein